jgi:hypothetical protein
LDYWGQQPDFAKVKGVFDLMKIIFGSISCVGCLVASILIIYQARHYQTIAQMMPNGKGGFMAPSDGYIIGLALFILSVASIVMVFKSCRDRKIDQ